MRRWVKWRLPIVAQEAPEAREDRSRCGNADDDEESKWADSESELTSWGERTRTSNFPQATAPPVKRVSPKDNDLADGRSPGKGRKTPKSDPETVTKPSRASAPLKDL